MLKKPFAKNDELKKPFTKIDKLEKPFTKNDFPTMGVNEKTEKPENDGSKVGISDEATKICLDDKSYTIQDEQSRKVSDHNAQENVMVSPSSGDEKATILEKIGGAVLSPLNGETLGSDGQLLGPARIYKPKPIDNRKYGTPKLGIDQIVNEMKAHYNIRSNNKKLYLFYYYPMRYVLLQDNQPQQLIKKFCREELGYSCSVQEIDMVYKTLHYDDQIARIKKPLEPHIWPFANGLVDIMTGKMIPNPENFFYTTCFRCRYIPDAGCPTFESLLDSISGGDAFVKERIWQIIGYTLSGDMAAKSFFTFYGPKDTGKSLLANIIAGIFQEDAVASCSIHNFGSKFASSEMVDKRLVLCMDLTDIPVNAAAVGMVKTITGGDLVRVEGKYKDARTERLRCVILFGTNHMICTERQDVAFDDRQIIVPFSYPVPKKEQDRNLAEKIAQEQSGIVNAAMRAYMRLVRNHYEFAHVPKAFIDEHIEIDPVKVIDDFMSSCCDYTDGNAKTATEDLYRAYKNFCNEKSILPLEKNEFSQKFKELNPDLMKKKIDSSRQGFVGVRTKAFSIGEGG